MFIQLRILFLSILLFFLGLCCDDSTSVTDLSGNTNQSIDYPCLAALDDCSNQLDIKHGTFNFFSSYHIDSISNVSGAVISVHGNSRNADDYFDKMISVLTSQGLKDDVMIIAPKFGTIYEQKTEKDWYWNSTSWKWGMESYMLDNLSISSFEVIDSLISRLSDKSYFPELTDILITGHSSGAAFVHLYSGSKTNNLWNNVNLHFSVVNNQYFLHSESSRLQADGTLSILNNCDNYNDWPYGLENLNPFMDLFGKETLKNNFHSNEVVYFIGEDDNQTSGITPGCQYEILGTNRYDKNINFNTYMNSIHPSNQHSFNVIPNVGHSTNCYSSPIFLNYINTIF